ncbi:COG2 family protein [Megaselia abdita]
MDTVNLNELCFDKNEFMKTNFSVDLFLYQHRNSAGSLELLRDNLGIYLKFLRASMIDLINEDYSDFICLSGNLSNLNEHLVGISAEFDTIKTNVTTLKTILSENEQQIEDCLTKKKNIRGFKRQLESLKQVHFLIEKLENIIASKFQDETTNPVDIERSVLELIELKFNKNSCSEYLQNEEVQKIANIESKILEKLKEYFLYSLKTSKTSSDNLERSLRIYVTLDACKEAEEIFKTSIVSPYMETHINENYLQTNGFPGILNEILNFISLHMTDILRITLFSDKLKGFNFLLNSFWANVERKIETNISSIFAPGNSDVFYGKFKCSQDFLKQIEKIFPNEKYVEEFRRHKQTLSFQSKWNLPVYFQICFQDISNPLETCLDISLDKEKFVNKNGFSLQPFHMALKSIEKCWQEGIFLVEVFPKFWRLTLQIINRLRRWIIDSLDSLKSQKITDLSQYDVLLTFYVDIVTFTSHFPSLSKTVALKIPNEFVADLKDLVRKTFDESKDSFDQLLKSIETNITNLLVLDCGEFIKQVNDLPRMYRKTNRDVPTRNSIYMDQMLKPIRAFQENSTQKLGKDTTKRVLFTVFESLTERYNSSVCQVLESVQKTEDSLRRLRNVKSGNSFTQSENHVSDDDKIRIQLKVDVVSWTNEITKLQFQPSDIRKLLELNSFVDQFNK